MSDHDRFARVDAMFRAACQLEGDAQRAFLAEACGENASLRAQVESLLRADANAAGPLDAPPSFASSLIAEACVDQGVTVELPHHISGYRIVRKVGAGGMGTVFEAEQAQPRRRVALKVISPGLVSRSMLKRFQFETEILARLQHPGIAQIYAAGTFDTGNDAQPYFAMEFVDGTPILSFATARQLSMRRRLQLIALVCDAVQHAHQRGVIHRDLKPANVLVTADGQPKILDFGVARATDPEAQVTTLQTNIGLIVGTVPYMSPEQAAGDAGAVDTRSDVYSLGVLGYELLTGRLPYDVREKMLHEALRSIREDDPTPISTHQRLLAGDVATIIGKAIAKDRERRYESAAALADDIRRFLSDEPIEARPPSVIYQMRKFARRNRALTASLAVLFGALFVLSFGAVYAAAREHGLRQRAETEADIASEINLFLRMDVLAAADPSRAANADVTILEVLDEAALRIEGRFADKPEVHAAIRQTIADTYIELGRFDEAEEQFEAARTVLALVPSDQRHATIDLDTTEGRLRVGQGRYEEAEAIFRNLVARASDRWGDQHPDVMQYEHELASILWGLGEFDESRQLLERGLERQRRQPGMEELTLQSMNSLAIVYDELGEYDKAEQLYLETLALRRTNSGEHHWDTINTMISLGQLYTNMQKDAEAEAIMLDARSCLEARHAPPDHPIFIALINNLALLYLYTERFEEAVPMFEAILESGRRIEGPTHPNTLTTLHNLASATLMLERFESARDLFAETLRWRTDTLGPNHPDTLLTQGMLGRTQGKLGDYASAVATLEDTYHRMSDRTDLGPDHPFARRTAEMVGLMYRAWGKPEEAAQWKAMADAK